MTTARITAMMLDGTKHEGTGVYMALADRVAFERKYASSILDIARMARTALKDQGVEVKEAAGNEDALAGLTEERTAFFSWRVLRRAEIPCGEFDEFLDGVEEIKIETLDGPVDPTEADLQPGT